MRCVLFGYGYWGKIVERYIQQSEEFELTGIIDPHYEPHAELNEVLNSRAVDCAFVCVPVRQHYQIVKRLLEHKIHVFCEKPLCTDVVEMKELFCLSEQNHTVLFTDYVYTVSPSLSCVRQHLKDFGRIQYIDMHIKQFGRFYQHDDVFDVIGVHMVSALVYLLGGGTSLVDIQVLKTDVVAEGHNCLPAAGIVFFNACGINGKIECSLLSDKKERKIKILCEHGLIVLDMMSDVSVRLISHTVNGESIRQTDAGQYQFDESNNLAAVLKHFYHSIIAGDSSNRSIAEQTGSIMNQIKKCYRYIFEK